LTKSNLLRGNNHLPQGILIIGIGNDYRSDDAAGLVVAHRLQEKKNRHIAVTEHSGEGTTLLEAWSGWERVILVDAVRSGAPPGTIHRFDAWAGALPASLFTASSHAFGVAQAVELARALGELPRQVLLLYGIEGQRFAAGVDLSPVVEQAVREVARMIDCYTDSSSSASRPRRSSASSVKRLGRKKR
jgi:hydrogenase maturation protease